jgi:hypothetical protein
VESTGGPADDAALLPTFIEFARRLRTRPEGPSRPHCLPLLTPSQVCERAERPALANAAAHGRVRLRFAVAGGWADVTGRLRPDGCIADGEVRHIRASQPGRPTVGQ